MAGRRIWKALELRDPPMDKAIIAHADMQQFRNADMDLQFEHGFSATRIARRFTDVYGHSVVYDGRFHAVIDPSLKPWDIAASVPYTLLTLQTKA